MDRVAFKMILVPGSAEEYKRRHDHVWPEIAALLKQTGVSEYSIFLEEENHTLYAYLKAADSKLLDTLQTNAIMHKWWAYMADISVSNADNSPVVIPLTEVFYLP
jgi:L-rhamnose mutarotase